MTEPLIFPPSQEKRTAMAKDLVRRLNINLDENINILLDVPEISYPLTDEMEKSIGFITRVNNALPQIRSVSEEVMLSFLVDRFMGPNYKAQIEPPRLIGLLAKVLDQDKIEEMLLGIKLLHLGYPQRYPESAQLGEDVFLVGAAQCAIDLSRIIYQNTPNSNIKSLAKVFMIHFAAIQGLLTGIKTNSYVAAMDPENVGDILKQMAILMQLKDKEQLQKAVTKVIFEGGTATPTSKLGENTHFSQITLTQNPSTDS